MNREQPRKNDKGPVDKDPATQDGNVKVKASWIKSQVIRISLIAIGAIIGIVLLCLFVTTQGKSTEQRFMERYVMVPLPASMVHVKTLGMNVASSNGSGNCVVAYEMDPKDLENILQNSQLPQRAVEVGQEQLEKMGMAYRYVWPDEKEKLEYYMLGGSTPQGLLGSVLIITTPKHDKALFFVTEM